MRNADIIFSDYRKATNTYINLSMSLLFTPLTACLVRKMKLKKDKIEGEMEWNRGVITIIMFGSLE